MTTIALIRHGQTPWNAVGRLQGSSDIILDNAGRAQAARAAEYLLAEVPDAPWAAIRHSPLKRAAESAAIVASTLAVPKVKPMSSLAERDFGEGEGLTMAECAQIWPATAVDDVLAARENIPGVEPPGLVVARGLHAISKLTDQYQDGFVVAVSHGTLMRFTLTEIIGDSFDYIPNGGVVVLETWREGDGLGARIMAQSHPQPERGAAAVGLADGSAETPTETD